MAVSRLQMQTLFSGDSLPAELDEQGVRIQAWSSQPSQTLLSALQTHQKMLWNVPRSNSVFVGRSALLARLAAIPTELCASIAIMDKGLEGVGKTSLALHYAEYSNAHNLRVWLRAENPPVLLQDYLAFAIQLGYSGDRLSEAQAYMQNSLSTHPHWLLIFDNVEHYESIQAYIPAGSGTVLLTSRYADWPSTFEVVAVDVMLEPEAVALLQSFSPTQPLPSLQRLAQVLGYLPLALAQAGGYLQESGLSAKDYLKLYNQDSFQALRLLSQFPQEAQVIWIVSSWNLIFKRLQSSEQGQQALVLLGLCAYLAPEAIPTALLGAALKERYPLCPEPSLQLNTCLGLLARYSLLKRQENQVSIHRMLQRVLAHQHPLNPAEYRRWATVLHREYNRKTQVREDEARQKALLPSLQSFVGHYQPHWNSDRDTLLSHARLLSDRGTVFQYRFGHHAEAKATFEQSLAIFERAYGPEHVEIAHTVLHLAHTLKSLGKISESQFCFKRAHRLFLAAYGAKHAYTQLALENMEGGGRAFIFRQYGSKRESISGLPEEKKILVHRCCVA